jgi:hypothetical protein
VLLLLLLLLTLQLVSNRVGQHAQALVEAAHGLALGLGGQARVTRRWRVVLAVLEQLDGTTHQAATVLLQDPDLHGRHAEDTYECES